MKLNKIYFDSYKSLIEEELVINDGCIGIVGINESGKTNILNAIRVLNENENLNSSHSPKIDRDKNPKIRFDFKLDHDLKIDVNLILDDWFVDNCIIDPDSVNIEFDVRYIVEYDISSNIENRTFEIINLNIPEEVLILKEEYLEDISKFLHNSEYLDLNEVVVITSNQLSESLRSQEKLKTDFLESKNKLSEIESEISSYEEDFIAKNEDEAKIEDDEHYKKLTQTLKTIKEENDSLSLLVDQVCLLYTSPSPRDRG